MNPYSEYQHGDVNSSSHDKRPLSTTSDQEYSESSKRQCTRDEPEDVLSETQQQVLPTCSQCGETFVRNTALTRHIKQVHEEDRPYCCDVPGCGKCFKRRDILMRHRATHTKEGYVECLACGLSCRPDSLQEHLASRGGLCRVGHEAMLRAMAARADVVQSDEMPIEISSISPANDSAVVLPTLSDDLYEGTTLSSSSAASGPTFVPDSPKPEPEDYQCDPILNIADSDGGIAETEVLAAIPAMWPELYERILRPKAILNSFTSRARDTRLDTAHPAFGGECAICNESLGSTREEVFQHVKQHVQKPPMPRWKCEGCGVAFCYTVDLVAHELCKTGTDECHSLRSPNSELPWLESATRKDFERDLRTWEKYQLFLFLQAIYTLMETSADHNRNSLSSLPERFKRWSAFSLESTMSFRSWHSSRDKSSLLDMDSLRGKFAAVSLWPDQQQGNKDKQRLLIVGPATGNIALLRRLDAVCEARKARVKASRRVCYDVSLTIDAQQRCFSILQCPADAIDILDLLRMVDGVVVCYSPTERRSFDQALSLRQLMQQQQIDVPTVLSSVDADIWGSLSVASAEGAALARDWGNVPFFETDVTWADRNTLLLFEALVRRIKMPAESPTIESVEATPMAYAVRKRLIDRLSGRDAIARGRSRNRNVNLSQSINVSTPDNDWRTQISRPIQIMAEA